MIAYEIRRHQTSAAPVPPTRHIRDVLNDRRAGFNVDPLSMTPAAKEAAEVARLARQHALAEGEKITIPPAWMPLGAKKKEPPVNLHNAPTGVSAIGMGKQMYTKWLNQFVYGRFDKGTLVTTRGVPYVPGQSPRVWWTVIEIQEVHYLAEIDRSTRDPKAVGLSTGLRKFTGPVWYPPAILRPLHKEEIDEIDRLRDKAQPRPLCSTALSEPVSDVGTKPGDDSNSS